LLHDSINYKDYALKRNNINKTIYKDIGNNKLRLTFKKFPIKILKQNNDNNNKNNLKIDSTNKTFLPKTLEEIRENNNNKTNEKINNTYMINNDIKEILNNNNNNGYKINFEKNKKLYNKFKQKFLIYKPKLLSQLNSPFYTPVPPISLKKKGLKTVSLKNSLLQKSKSASFLTDDNNMNSLLITCNSLKVLRDKKILDKNILNNEQKFYEKIKEELLPKKIKKIKKKIFLSRYDFFNYDPKKWIKNKDETKDVKDMNNMLDEVNELLSENILKMKNKAEFYNNKLNYVKNKRHSIEIEINKILE
jgi:hypothetical protein